MKKVSIETGRTEPWRALVGDDGLTLGIDTFGASAPDKVLAQSSDSPSIGQLALVVSAEASRLGHDARVIRKARTTVARHSKRRAARPPLQAPVEAMEREPILADARENAGGPVRTRKENNGTRVGSLHPSGFEIRDWAGDRSQLQKSPSVALVKI